MRVMGLFDFPGHKIHPWFLFYVLPALLIVGILASIIMF